MAITENADDEQIVERKPKVSKVEKIENSQEYYPKCLCIGCGQAGTKLTIKLGLALKSKKNNVYINTSFKDLAGIADIDETRTVKIGKTVEGCSKQRENGEALLKEYQNVVVEALERYILEDSYDFVFVAFSTSGGTGSGIGPKVTAILNSNVLIDQCKEKFGKAPIVFGIPLLPEITTVEGSLSYNNTINCLKDIDKFVSKDLARYILVNNGSLTDRQKKVDRVAQLDKVNTNVVTLLSRYITRYGTSRISNLDRADRFGALEVMGLHSFMLLDGLGNRGDIEPFFIPDGERVKRVCYEVPEKSENAVLKVISTTRTAIDDMISGVYDIDDPRNENLTPIIGFHGFKNTSKISEQYDTAIRMLEEKNRKIERDNEYNSSGFDNIEALNESRKAEYGRSGANSIEDIFA